MRRPDLRGVLLAFPLLCLTACASSSSKDALPDAMPQGAGGTSVGGTAGTTGIGGAGAGGGGTAGTNLGGSAGVGGSVGGAGAGGGLGGVGAMAGTAGMGGAGGALGGTGGTAGGAGSGGNGGSGGTGFDRPMRVLLYHFSTLSIASVPQQLDLFEEKLGEWGYAVDRSDDPSVINEDNLANYAAVGMINTCFSPFGANNATGEPQSTALQAFLQDGGGLFGTHCADVTFQSANPPALYNELLGGRASSQNFEGTSQCRKLEAHPTVDALPDTFSYNGNLDNTDFIADDTVVLVRCTWGDQANTDIIVSWVRTEGTGRVFFTNMAKEAVYLTDATVGDNHILAGLGWVLHR